MVPRWERHTLAHFGPTCGAPDLAILDPKRGPQGVILSPLGVILGPPRGLLGPFWGGTVSVTTLVAVTFRHGRVTRLGGGAFPLRNMLLAPRLETMRGPTRSLLALVSWTRANSQVQVPNDLLQRRDASEYRSLPSPPEAVASCEVSGRRLTFASSARVVEAGRKFYPRLACRPAAT